MKHIFKAGVSDFKSYKLYHYTCCGCGDSFSSYDGNKHRSKECNYHKNCKEKYGD